MYKVSVILPVYNESGIIHRTVSAVIDFAAQNPQYYFLFVNDASVDETGSLIKAKIKGIPNIALIESPQNLGKAGALKLGLQQTDTDYICFTDGDLAYSLDHLYKLVESLESHEVAIGNRNLSENHLRNVKRVVAGEAFNRLVRILLSLPITDTQAGIKGFRKDAARKLFGLHLINDFAFDAELLYIAKLKGYRIGQIPATVDVDHQHLPSTVKIMSHSPGMLFSLFRILFYRISGKYADKR
jgi:dolichyl-phosphate beta-glucosyltransferase